MHYYILYIVLLVFNIPFQVQAPDYNFHPKLISPSFSTGNGSVIYFDEGHNNLHTLKDRLFNTGRLLEDDGYIVKPLKEKTFFTAPITL